MFYIYKDKQKIFFKIEYDYDSINTYLNLFLILPNLKYYILFFRYMTIN